MFKKKKIEIPKGDMLELQQYPQPKFPNPSFQQNFNRFQEIIKKLAEKRELFDVSIPNTFFLPVP
jgi:hypothetical protein